MGSCTTNSIPVDQAPYFEPSEICGTPGLLPVCPAGTPGGLGTLPTIFKGPIWDLEMKPRLEQILNNPGRLNYFEPQTTFRFTVSRTF